VAGEEGGEEGREVRGGVGSGVGDVVGMRWGGGGVLRIAPARGSALLFLSVRRDAPTRGLPHMWHGGKPSPAIALLIPDTTCYLPSGARASTPCPLSRPARIPFDVTPTCHPLDPLDPGLTPTLGCRLVHSVPPLASGCRVHRGEKWTLQFFKELPYSTPPPVTLSTA